MVYSKFLGPSKTHGSFLPWETCFIFVSWDDFGHHVQGDLYYCTTAVLVGA